MDCVVGKQGGSGAALLVLSERKSRQEIIIKIPSKTQEFVVKAMDALENEYGDEFYERFKSITVDNGSEFLDFKGLERSIISPDIHIQRVRIYYAHPYSAWERATNENLNKIVRRFVAKGTDRGSRIKDVGALLQTPSSPEGSRSVITGRRTKGCIPGGCQGSR